jgi:hypothetical protein
LPQKGGTQKSAKKTRKSDLEIQKGWLGARGIQSISFFAPFCGY